MYSVADRVPGLLGAGLSVRKSRFFLVLRPLGDCRGSDKDRIDDNLFLLQFRPHEPRPLGVCRMERAD